MPCGSVLRADETFDQPATLEVHSDRWLVGPVVVARSVTDRPNFPAYADSLDRHDLL